MAFIGGERERARNETRKRTTVYTTGEGIKSHILLQPFPTKNYPRGDARKSADNRVKGILSQNEKFYDVLKNSARLTRYTFRARRACAHARARARLIYLTVPTQPPALSPNFSDENRRWWWWWWRWWCAGGRAFFRCPSGTFNLPEIPRNVIFLLWRHFSLSNGAARG